MQLHLHRCRAIFMARSEPTYAVNFARKTERRSVVSIKMLLLWSRLLLFLGYGIQAERTPFRFDRSEECSCWEGWNTRDGIIFHTTVGLICVFRRRIWSICGHLQTFSFLLFLGVTFSLWERPRERGLTVVSVGLLQKFLTCFSTILSRTSSCIGNSSQYSYKDSYRKLFRICFF